MLTYRKSLRSCSWCVVAVSLLALTVACSEAPSTSGVKKMQPGEEFSGFLGDYSELKPNTNMEGAMLTYLNPDAMKSLRRYVACIVDPVEVYVSTDADESSIPEMGREAVANYFQHALALAVSDAYPVVDSPGPLVLRVRAAVVGWGASGDYFSNSRTAA